MRRSVAAGLALLALLAGCAPAPSPGRRTGDGRPAYGGRFVFPLRSEPPSLSFIAGDQTAALIDRLVGDGLVDRDAAMKPVPRLASSWEFSPDGRRLTFHLRPGVRFHDGAPCTSADVAYTYERVIDPKSRAIARIDGFLPVERLETPDPLTVRVTYRSPFAPALDAWTVPILPRHLFAKEPDFPSSPRHRAPVGSGPFRFASWDPGRRIVLVANADYWGGRPYLDSIVFQIIPSSETTLQALLAGELDYAPLAPLQWESHAGSAAFAARFRSIRFVQLFTYYIAWRGDGSNPFFADPVVRRAMTLALDREGYVRSVLRGLGEVTPSLVSFETAPPGAERPAPLPYDPAAAASLLDAAGWRLNARTGLRAKAGTPFRFTLLIFSGGEDHVKFAQVAQESLRRIGVEMAIERLDWPTLFSRLTKGNFQATLSGFLHGTDPDDVYALLHSSQIAGGQNYAAFHDPSIDRWLEAGRSTLDAQERARLYREIDRRLRDLQPYTVLFSPAVQAALVRQAHNVVPSPRGILDHYPGAAAIYLEGGGRP